MCSFKKINILSFYFYNINFSFCLNIYTEELQKIEKKFISNNIKANIQSMGYEIEDKKRKEIKTKEDIKFIKEGNAIITIYNDVTRKNKDTDFNYIYGVLKEAENFDFSTTDRQYGGSIQYHILKSLLFNALKKEKIDTTNFEDYIKIFKNLKKKKIIGEYTYDNAEEYILKSIFNKVTYDDIKNTNVLTDYDDKFQHIGFYFDRFLKEVFKYIVNEETKFYSKIDNVSKTQIVTILNNFPVTEQEKYKIYVKFLFCLLSNDLNVVYDRKEDSFLLKSIDSYDKIGNKKIKNKEDLKKYKKEIGFLPIKNIENILNDVGVLKDLEKFFDYNEKVEPLKAYYEYQKEIREEFSEIATDNFNILFKFKNDIKFLQGRFILAYNYCKKYPSGYDDLLKIYNSLKDKKIKIENPDNSTVESNYSNILYNISDKEKINTTQDANTSFILGMDYNNYNGCISKIESFKQDISNTKKEIEELKKNYNLLCVNVNLARYNDVFFNNLLKKEFDQTTKKEIEKFKNTINSTLKNLKKELKSKIKKIKESNTTINTSKYSDVFIDGLNFNNIKNEEKEINKLYKNVIEEEKKKEDIKKEEKKKEENKIENKKVHKKIEKIKKEEENKDVKEDNINKNVKNENVDKENKEEPKKKEYINNKEVKKENINDKENIKDKENKKEKKNINDKDIKKNKENKEELKKEEPKIEEKKKEEEKIEEKKPDEENIEKEKEKIEEFKKKDIKKEEEKEEPKIEKKEEKEDENNEENNENNEENEGDYEGEDGDYEGEEGDYEEGDENNEEVPKKEEKIEKKDEEEEEDDDDDDEKKDEKEKVEKKEGPKKEEKIEKKDEKEKAKIKDHKTKNKKKVGIITEKGKQYNNNSTTPKPCSCKKEGGSCKK